MDRTSKIAVLVILLLVGAAVVRGKIAPEKPRSPAIPTAKSTSSSPSPMLREIRAMEAVRASLRDPDSAEFRNVRTIGSVVCGEVNANNGYGGKSGYQRFISNGIISATENSMADGEMAKAWAQVC